MIKTNQTKYIIKDNGRAVSGFSRMFQGMIQFVGVGGTPKVFSTRQKAEDYISKYAGWAGIEIESCEIVSL